MKCKTLGLTLSLLLMSGAASAEVATQYTTDTQTQTFTGVAGKDSGVDDVSAFVFDAFDSSLGVLTGVYFRSVITVDGGVIGADNTTNEEVDGSGYIGASILIGDTTNDTVGLLDSSFKSIFSLQEMIDYTTFSLAADPTLSVGGDGDDTFSMAGSLHEYDSGTLSVGSYFFDDYLDSNGETFSISFNTTSEVFVDALGAQNTFKTASMELSLELYYTYEDFAEPEISEPASDVPAPLGFALFGFGLLGLARSRKNK